MRKPWQTKEWREKRAKFIKDKSCEWCGSTETPLTIHHPQKKNTLSDEKYMSFEGVMILCKRCAFAAHNRMHLCPSCKKKFVPNRFDVCFNCLPLETKAEIKERRPLLSILADSRRMIKVIAPCGRKEKISKLAYDVMGTFEVCHNCDKVNDCDDLKKSEQEGADKVAVR